MTIIIAWCVSLLFMVLIGVVLGVNKVYGMMEENADEMPKFLPSRDSTDMKVVHNDWFLKSGNYENYRKFLLNPRAYEKVSNSVSNNVGNIDVDNSGVCNNSSNKVDNEI